MLTSGRLGSLEDAVVAAVGEDALARIRRRCGTEFSLATLLETIQTIPDGNEKEAMVRVAQIIQDSHAALASRTVSGEPTPE